MRERQRQRQTDRQTERPGMVVKEKKSSHVAIVCESKITKHMKFWCSMSIFCFRAALAYLGLQLRATFQKEIDKEEAEIKKNEKKWKENLRKLSWSVAAVTRKRGAENYFIWGEELSKLNISSQSKAQCWFRKQKTELKIVEKTKICISAMLKPYSASSFCLPNKNRVGVAHGDGTNLEVVCTYDRRRHRNCFQTGPAQAFPKKQTSLEVRVQLLHRSTHVDLLVSRSINMLSVTDFDPKGVISGVRVQAGLYLDMLDADRSPNAVSVHAGTSQVDFFIFILYLFYTLYMARRQCEGIGWEGCVMWGLTYLLVCLLHVHWHVSKNNAAPFLKDVRFEADWRIAGREGVESICCLVERRVKH